MRPTFVLAVALQAVLMVAVGCQGARHGAAPPSAPVANPERYGGSSNFIFNPSFMQGLAGWQGYGEHTAIRLVKGAAKDGAEYGSAVALGTQPYGIGWLRAVGSPSPGARYGFSVWAKGDPFGQVTHVQLRGVSPSGRERILSDSHRIVGGRWQHLFTSARVPRGIISVNAYIFSTNDIALYARLSVDAAVFRRLS